MTIDIIITENPHYNASMAFVENITTKVDGVFSWTIEAFGGFATAHFEMMVSEADAWTMLQRIGKRVAFLSPDAPDSSLLCWEGMISTVNIDDGGATISRSLENVYNHVRVNYTGVDDTVDPPQTAGYEGTDGADDLASQALYGRRDLLYQAGTVGGGATTALRRIARGNRIRDLFLAQFANPRAGTTTLRRGGGSSVSSMRVSVDCVGFAQELAVKFHGETDITVVTVDTIIKSILANTNYGTYLGYPIAPAYTLGWKLDFISTDTSGVTANTITTSRYNFTDKTTRTYLDELMRLGDGATGRRTFWGVYENRKFFTTVEPSSYDYITRRSDSSEAIYDRRTGAIVPPWLVRPAKVIGVPDLLPDETVVTDVLNTAKAFLIGTVEFTAPATVVLTPVAPDPSGMWGTAQLMQDGYAPTWTQVPGGGFVGGLPPIPGLGGG